MSKEDQAEKAVDELQQLPIPPQTNPLAVSVYIAYAVVAEEYLRNAVKGGGIVTHITDSSAFGKLWQITMLVSCLLCITAQFMHSPRKLLTGIALEVFGSFLLGGMLTVYLLAAILSVGWSNFPVISGAALCGIAIGNYLRGIQVLRLRGRFIRAADQLLNVASIREKK